MCPTRGFSIALTLLIALAGCSGLNKNQNVAKKEKNRPPHESFDRELSFARLSERHKQSDMAGKVYRKVLQEQPGNQLAQHRLAVIAAKQGKLETALTHFQKAEAAGPPTADLLSDLGYALQLQGNLEGAESKLRAAVELDPQNKKAINNLGLVLGYQGRFEESYTAFAKAVSPAKAHSNVAYCQAQLGQFELARASYHRALDMETDHRPAAEALVQLSAHKEMLAKRVSREAQTAEAAGAAKQSAAKQIALVQHETPLQKQAPIHRGVITPLPRRLPAVSSSDNVVDQ